MCILHRKRLEELDGSRFVEMQGHGPDYYIQMIHRSWGMRLEWQNYNKKNNNNEKSQQDCIPSCVNIHGSTVGWLGWFGRRFGITGLRETF